MDRLKYSLKVGILALLLFCTLNYLVPMQSNAFFNNYIFGNFCCVTYAFSLYIFRNFKEMT